MNDFGLNLSAGESQASSLRRASLVCCLLAAVAVSLALAACGQKTKAVKTGMNEENVIAGTDFKVAWNKPQTGQLVLPVVKCQNPVPVETNDMQLARARAVVQPTAAPVASEAAAVAQATEATEATAQAPIESVFALGVPRSSSTDSRDQAKSGEPTSAPQAGKSYHYEIQQLIANIITTDDNSSMTVKYTISHDEKAEKKAEDGAKKAGWRSEVLCSGVAPGIDLGLHVETPDVIHPSGGVQSFRVYDFVLTDRGPKGRTSKEQKLEGDAVVDLGEMRIGREDYTADEIKPGALVSSRTYVHKGTVESPQVIELRQSLERTQPDGTKVYINWASTLELVEDKPSEPTPIKF